MALRTGAEATAAPAEGGIYEHPVTTKRGGDSQHALAEGSPRNVTVLVGSQMESGIWALERARGVRLPDGEGGTEFRRKGGAQ